MSFIFDGIVWMDTVVDKLAWKHGVLPHEVEEILTGKCRIFRAESGNIDGEDLYNALGKTRAGRYLSVFFIKKLDRKALIITAREMNKREKNRYEK